MVKIAKINTRYLRWKWVNFKVNDQKHFTDWIISEYWRYDCDTSRYLKYVFAVGENGEFKYYYVTHEFYWHNYGQEDSRVENDFDIKEITESQARSYLAENGYKWQVV